MVVEERGEEEEEKEGPAQEEGADKEAESEELDHPYDMLTRVQIDFEPYVLLLQVKANPRSSRQAEVDPRHWYSQVPWRKVGS